MDFFDFSFWQSFVSNLFSTIIGVALGIPVAFWISRQVESVNEKEKRQKTLIALRIELNHIDMRVSNWIESSTGVSKDIDMANIGISLSDETWKAFSDGGELQWIKNPLILDALAGMYSEIARIKLLSDRYFTLLLNDRTDTQLLRSSTGAQLFAGLYKLHEDIKKMIDLLVKFQ